MERQAGQMRKIIFRELLQRTSFYMTDSAWWNRKIGVLKTLSEEKYSESFWRLFFQERSLKNNLSLHRAELAQRIEVS